MKKILLASLLACGLTAQAQTQEPEVKVEFVPHWYLQLQAGAAYTLGEAKFKDLISPTAQIAAGYQFNPWLGLRLQVSGWEGKGGWPAGLASDNPNRPTTAPFETPAYKYKWNYIAPGLDLKLSLTNLIFGWNPNRVFNLGILAGGAANIAWNNKDAQNVPYFHSRPDLYQLEYLWDGTKVRPVGRFGLDMDFRCSDRVAINLEGNANILSDKYNSKKAGNADWYFNVLLGVKVALGPTVKRTVIEQPVDTVPAPPVKKPEPVKPPVVIKKPELRTEIFYAIRETVAVGSEEAKLRNLISFLKENTDTKVTVTGYADAGTGNPKINEMYASQRAQNVAKALIEAGIAESRITVDSKGDTVQPFSENDKNRVTIAIAKE